MKKRIRKIAGAVFLALAIALTQIPASFAEAFVPGEEFKRDGDTLISYTGTASVVSVPAGIKTIGTDAFAGNRHIERVTIPASVEVIENGAFRDCSALDSVYFSEGLTTIESGAFAMCPELDTVKFSSTIMELGAGVFAGDDELKSVILGKNTYFVMSDGALYSRDKTKLIQVFAGREGDSFKMPDSVSHIERYAFWGCDELEYVGLSAHLDEIPEFSFSNCSSLKEVSVPYSVRKIGAKAFEDCTSLAYVTLPVSVTTIHQTAFDGCYNLKIMAEEGTAAYEFAKAFESVKLLQMEDETSEVSENTIGAIYRDTVVKKEKNTVETEVVEEDAKDSPQDVYDPSNPSDVSKLNVSDYYAVDSSDVIGKTRVVGGKAVVLYDGLGGQQNSADAVSQNDSGMKADFTAEDDGSHTIAKKKYYQATSFQGVEIADTIEKIDDFAFARSQAETVVIPESVTHIGYGAFYHCENLADVEIPSGVKTIEPEAFARTAYLENWENGGNADDFLVVGDGILLAYKGNAARIVIPATVKKIAGNVFQNHAEITEVILSDSLTEIGEAAFSGCTSLSKVRGLEKVNNICDRAFAMCPLTSLTVGEQTEEIGLGAFRLAAPDAVVFEAGETLPSVSYEKTATRLENDGFRSLVFSDVDTAVIKNTSIPLKNTILDERYLGFRGFVVTILDKEGNQACLVYCTKYPNETSGLVEIPQYVRVNGKNYSLTSAVPGAFDAYETYDYWGNGTEIKGLILPPALGKAEDYDTVLPLQTADEESSEEVTTVVLQTDYENADKVTAQVKDDVEEYLLYVDTDTEAEKQLSEAVGSVYGETVEGQLNMLDLSLVERKSNVAISNFGDIAVKISLPVSETMAEQNICAVTLAEDGTLQTIYGTKEVRDGQNYFEFSTNHFSVYGVYAGIGETGEKIKAESMQLLNKDDSPDTGERFNPKWLLAFASLFAGLALLIGIPVRKRI